MADISRKSQVAIEYAYRFKEAHESSYVFWVYGGSVPRFYQGYKKIAQALDLPGWDDPDVSVLDLVSQWLETTTSSYLLILDNADNLLHYWPNKYKTAPTHDEPDVNLSSYLPGIQSGGKILITSRDSRVAGRLSRPYKPVLLQHMSIEEAVELFRSDLMKNEIEASDEEVAKVARALDCLPLAITQAASFIDENGISVAEYLKMLDSDDAEEYLQEELDDSRRDEDSINSVFRSWKLSFDQITKQKPRAAELLSLLGMFDRQSIPKWLLKVPEVITSAGVLQSFNLVFSPEGTSAFQLHRLCQRFVRIWLKRAGTLQRWQDAALNCVSQAYPTEIGFQERSTCETLAPHVATLLTYEYKSDTARLDLAHLLCWAADFDIERGLYQQALERAKQSLELFKDLVPSDDDRVASAMWLYGRLIYYGAKSQSDLLFAQELLQASLQTSSPSTLTFAESAFELAHLFYVLDKKKECLEMGRKSFECWQSIEGKSSVRTLDNWHDYSLQLAMFGYREEAIANWRDIIRLCPQSDASQNTKSIYTWRSLASIAEFQDDSSTAEILYAKLVELGSSIYGPEHVHVLDYRLSNAEQILRQNKPQRALEACRLALKSCVNKSEWRIAATCYEMMAECCLLENDTSREEELRLKCSDLHSKHLADNKESAEAIEATARCLLSNCKFEQANQLLQEVLSWREAKLGTNHPGTLEAIELAGICSSYLGRDDEAESAYKRAIDHSVNRNPRLVQNLCTALWNQSKWNELEHLCRDTLAQDDGEYAPELEQMLAAALEKQGKSSEAVVLKMKRLSEDSGHVAEGSRLLPKVPPRRSSIPPRFGRIIHPRTWSA